MSEGVGSNPSFSRFLRYSRKRLRRTERALIVIEPRSVKRSSGRPNGPWYSHAVDYSTSQQSTLKLRSVKRRKGNHGYLIATLVLGYSGQHCLLEIKLQ